MISFELEGVQLSKSLQANPRALEKLKPTLVVAKVLARHIQERLRQGRTATTAKPYKSDKGYKVSEDYARAAGAEATAYKSSAEFHAQAGGKPGVVTGGLLRSIRARNWGSKGAIIEAAGSSLARATKKPKNLDEKIKKIRAQAREQIAKRKNKAGKDRVRQRRDERIAKLKAGKPGKIQNRKKMSTVYAKLRINMTQPSDSEVDAIASAVAGIAQREVAEMFGATVESRPTGGNSRLLRKLRRQLQR